MRPRLRPCDGGVDHQPLQPRHVGVREPARVLPEAEPPELAVGVPEHAEQRAPRRATSSRWRSRAVATSRRAAPGRKPTEPPASLTRTQRSTTASRRRRRPTPARHGLDARRLEVRHRLAVRLVPHPPRAHLHESRGRGGAQRCRVDRVDHGRHERVRAVLDRPGDDGARDLPAETGTEPVVREPVVEVEVPVVGVLVPQARPPDDVIGRAVDDDGIPEPVPLPVGEVGGEPLAAPLGTRHARGRVGVRCGGRRAGGGSLEVVGPRAPQHRRVGRRLHVGRTSRVGSGARGHCHVAHPPRPPRQSTARPAEGPHRGALRRRAVAVSWRRRRMPRGRAPWSA